MHALAAIARMKLPVHVIGLIPAVENMPSGSSYHPGDILKTITGLYNEYGEDRYRPSVLLKKMAGEWILTPTSEGTDIKLTVDFEFGIPMISGLLNPILKKKVRDNSMNMLKAVKEKMEDALVPNVDR